MQRSVFYQTIYALQTKVIVQFLLKILIGHMLFNSDFSCYDVNICPEALQTWPQSGTTSTNGRNSSQFLYAQNINIA